MITKYNITNDDDITLTIFFMISLQPSSVIQINTTNIESKRESKLVNSLSGFFSVLPQNTLFPNLVTEHVSEHSYVYSSYILKKLPPSVLKQRYFRNPENNYVPAIAKINKKKEIINKIFDNSSLVFISANIICYKS